MRLRMLRNNIMNERALACRASAYYTRVSPSTLARRMRIVTWSSRSQSKVHNAG